jgi:hypothetical protein
LLIVGTAPPPRFSLPKTVERGGLKTDDVDFYYGSYDNYMWVLLENIAEDIDGETLSLSDLSSDKCPDVMRDFLWRHKLWMRDVLQTYERKKGKETSPYDSDIVRPIATQFTEFRPIFSKLSHLATVAFTSEQAAAWTYEALHDQGLIEQACEKQFTQWKSMDVDLSVREYIELKLRHRFCEAAF